MERCIPKYEIRDWKYERLEKFSRFFVLSHRPACVWQVRTEKVTDYADKKEFRVSVKICVFDLWISVGNKKAPIAIVFGTEALCKLNLIIAH